ncbi:unnamed protein product, partial [marine sediment metagenome]
AIKYAKQFEIRDSPIETAIIQNGAVRDYFKGYRDCINL